MRSRPPGWQNDRCETSGRQRRSAARDVLPGGAARALVTVTERVSSDTRASPTAAAMSVRWHRLPLELALLFAMFVAYRAGRLLTADHTSAAFANARELWHIERWLHLPMEQDVQTLLLHHVRLVELANTYYAVVHFPATVAFLIWMFVRRPAHYIWVRRSLIMMTAAALVLHVFFPLAPPRMRPDLGFVDTGALFGPNVYGPPEGGSIANQFAAMPSLHIGWAVLVAVGLIVATRSRWRWLVVAHPILTILVVVGTANHWWLDGAVAILLLGGAMLISAGLDRVRVNTFLRRQGRATTSSP
jgi:PAP2 superfamily